MATETGAAETRAVPREATATAIAEEANMRELTDLVLISPDDCGVTLRRIRAAARR